MWHEDSWQPYGEHDAPATSSWRHRLSGASSTVPNGGAGSPYGRGYSRHYQPCHRPMAPSMGPLQHSPTLAAAARELSWRNTTGGWGSPSLHNGVTAMAPSWHDEMAAYHHRQQQLARAHARALHEAALSKLSSVEITTPHAGGDLRAKPIVCESASGKKDDSKIGTDGTGSNLYNDFSAPSKPPEVELRFDRSAIRITVSWTLPEMSSLYKCKQRIEVRDSLTIIEEDTLAPHITSFRFRTIPGQEYYFSLIAYDAKGVIVASSQKKCRAMFSLPEIDKLLVKAHSFIGSAMQPFSLLYRCKPKIYWDDIYLRRNGIMERYLKDNNGQAASPINGEISGMFFSAKTLADGSLPPSSPFGDIRMILPAISLLDPNRISAFFCDFYCNRLTHYVTIVICERNSQTERFCKEKLRPVDLKDDRFLRITPTNNPNMPYAFYTNRSVWVEIYYTENIPMNWGRFDHIVATGAGTSRVGGLPHNKSCLSCNLYPSGPVSGANTEPMEDLLASYETSRIIQREADGGEGFNIFPRNTTRYTTLGCIQAELLAPSSPTIYEISKDDYLEVAEVLVYCVDRVVYEDSQAHLREIFDNAVNYEQENAEETRAELAAASIEAPLPVKVKEEEEDQIEVKQQEKNDDELKLVDDDIVVVEDETMDAESRLMKMLDRVTERLPKSVPSGVANLVAKIRALAKEMNHGFRQINTEISQKVGVDSRKRTFALASEVHEDKENQPESDQVDDGQPDIKAAQLADGQPDVKAVRLANDKADDEVCESWKSQNDVTPANSMTYASLQEGMQQRAAAGEEKGSLSVRNGQLNIITLDDDDDEHETEADMEEKEDAFEEYLERNEEFYQPVQ